MAVIVISDPPMSGDEIKAIRTRLGWNLRDLGKHTGMASSYLSKIERGEHPVTSLSVGRYNRLVTVLIEAKMNGKNAGA